jgi:hypothetical protein
MMAFYLVRWLAVFQVPAPCPSNWKTNEYTGEAVEPFSQTAQLCYEWKRKEMERRFFTRPEADEFVNHCPPGICTKMELEEVNP